MNKLKIFLPHILLMMYIVEFFVLSINPLDRATWWAENIPILIAVFVLVFTFRKFRFSNTAYILMAFFLMYHTIGGYYTFERVPFDWFNDFIGSTRNNFDRVGHFFVGVFAYPLAELFWRKRFVTRKWMAVLVGILALGTWGAVYEIIEAYYAVVQGGEQAANFLGSQGDIWDAQKDMFLDIIGAIVAGTFFLFWTSKKKQKKMQKKPKEKIEEKSLGMVCPRCGFEHDECIDGSCSAIMVCQQCKTLFNK